MTCLICDGPTTARPASIAPFLSQYCNLGITTTKSRFCAKCELVFFERRLTDAEASKLYTDYRGEEYNRVRTSIETWYGDYMKLFENNFSTYATERMKDYLSIVDVYPELNEIKEVLDFGGNGEMPARIFPSAAIFVDDLSAGFKGNANDQYEMIFASNVFEHVSDPVRDLAKLRNRMTPEGILFIDVPGPTQASLGEALIWQENRGGELYEMHEHINHFSQRSLGLLLKRVGLVPIFERRLNYGVVSAMAVQENSSVAKKYLAEKTTRSAEFDVKQAFAESKAAAALARSVDAKISTLNADFQASRSNSDELQKIYDSTSWKITAPIRTIKRSLIKFSRSA